MDTVLLRRLTLMFGCLLTLAATAARGDDRRSAPVGLPARIDQLVLPGGELETRALLSTTPLVLRIAAVYPHGDAFRYDLVYYGLEPGDYDLRNYLARRDGASLADLPELRVTIESVLPAGQITPHPLPPGPTPRVGGYRTALISLGALWSLGLLALLFRRRARNAGHQGRGEAAAVTLADRLRPLVERAMAGTLSRREQADLEFSLVAYWRRRLGLAHTGARDALATLHAHPEAGPLLRSLEAWLHHPTPPRDLDLTALLAPYRELPQDALDPSEPERSAAGAR